MIRVPYLKNSVRTQTLQTKKNHYICTFYFGCLKAIYEMFPPWLIGLKYDSLVNNFAKRGYRIDTPTCIIRAGLLSQKRRANKTE